MPDLNSINQWIWNCGKNDFDARVIWGNNGTITIQRSQLRGIRYTLRHWNHPDGWREKSNSQMLSLPTSDPHTFQDVSQVDHFAKRTTQQYWGKPFIIIGILVILWGYPDPEEEMITNVNGCFTRNDPYYYNEYNCTPPDVMCEELPLEEV